MLNKLKQWFNKPETEKVIEKKPVQEKKPRKPRKPKEQAPTNLSAKEIATQNGEPYINILRMELDPNDVNNGAFELDWNDKFVTNLIRAGYKIRPDDTDQMLVDRWFQTVCRNVALEVYEQQIADPDNRDLRSMRTRDLGNGRTEVS